MRKRHRLPTVAAVALVTTIVCVLVADRGDDAIAIGNTRVLVAPALRHEFGGDEWQQFRVSVRQYLAAYSCRNEIHFSVQAGVHRRHVDGVGKVQQLAHAEPGRVVFAPQSIRESAMRLHLPDSSRWRHAVLHEMTHACVPGNRRPFPMVLPTGDEIIAIHGFILFIANRPDIPGEAAWRTLDEAAADLLAASLDPSFRPTHPALVAFLLHLLKQSHVSLLELDRMHRGADLEGFATRVIGAPTRRWRQFLPAMMYAFDDAMRVPDPGAFALQVRRLAAAPAN